MILDTNAVSALAGREPALTRVLDRAEPPFISFIGIAEFQYGLLGSTRPQPGLDFLDRLAASVPVLLPTRETIPHYAWIADHLERKRRPIPQNDIWP